MTVTKPIRLTDIQLVLLASAAARDNGSLLPPPETLGDGLARIRKSIEQLIRRGLAAEAEIVDEAETWRAEGDRAIGVVITDEGRAAIGIEDVESDAAAEEPAPEPQAQPEEELVPFAPAPARPSKTADVLALLRRAEGATLDELVAATGWLPHTTRAALTGLRKKGHAIARGKRGETSCYYLVPEIAA